ncbi:MAG: HAD hydrolase family protein [Flavobacteriales bacterium]|nr:HAD hydrolase family protein [Flavobacteriales bacterium]
MFLEENIRGLCDKFGLDYLELLSDIGIDSVDEMTISDLEVVCEEYETDLNSLIFSHTFKTNDLKVKIAKIKLLVIDVDGVMTDGGMYFSETGDQYKKFNTKDGMAIIHLTKSNFQVAIISSGFKGEAVSKRAEMLGIQNCTVSRTPKIETLSRLCEEQGIGLENVAMIGDDINDLQVMQQIGLSACPRDAVNRIKKNSTIILNKNGGEGCVREFIDEYLLDTSIG